MTRTDRKLCWLTLAIFVVTLALIATVPVWSGGFTYTTHGPYGGVIQALTIDTSGRIYVGVYNGWIYTSTNNGESWSVSKAGIANGARNIVDLDAASNGLVYAASRGGGVFRTSNGGQNWTSVNTNLGNLTVLSILVDPADPNKQYAGTSGSGVYQRTDPGSWQDMRTGCVTCVVQDLAIDSGGTLYLAAAYNGTNYGVYRWSGTEWQAQNTGLPNATGAQTVLPTGSGLWAGTDGEGVFYSTGGTWSPRNSGLSGNALDVWKIAQDGNGNVYAGTAGGFYQWNSATSSWQLRVDDLPGRAQLVSAIVSPIGETLFIGSDGRGVFKSTDAGLSWVEKNEGLTGYLVRAIGINPQYDWRVYAGTFRGGIFWSPNGGESWSWRSEGLGDVEVESIAVTYPSGTPLYAGINGQGVYRSDNLGELWVPKNNGLVGPALFVYALALKPDINSTILYAGTEDGVYKTNDSGELWVRSSTNLPYAVTALAVDSRDGQENTVYAGTRQNGVYQSTDAGGQWNPLPGLTDDDAKILALTVDGDGVLYAGADGGLHMYSGGTWSETGPQVAIHALVTNPISPTVVYAGSAEGVSPVGVIEKTSQGWIPLTTGLGNWNVYALTIDDYYTQTLHAGTGGSSVWDYTFAEEPPPMAPEVGVDLDDGVSIVERGDVLSYTVTYYNAGSVDAVNVAITTTLPTYADYVSSNPPFTHLGGDLYGLVVDIIPSDSVGQASFVVQLHNTEDPPARIYSVATIADDGSSGPDPYLFNNMEEDIDYFVPPPAFFLDKDATPSPGSDVSPGDRISYTIEYGNDSNDTVLTGIVLTDVIPANATYVPDSIWPAEYGNDNDPAVLRWSVPNLNPKTSGTVGFQVTVNEPEPGTSSVSNKATADTQETDPIESDSVEHNIKTTLLLVSKTADPMPGSGISPGSSITYTIYYSNADEEAVTGIVLHDLYDRTEDYVFQWSSPPPTAGNDEWTIGTLNPGDHGQVEIGVRLNDTLPGNWTVSNEAFLTDGVGASYHSEVVTHTTVLAPDAPLVDFVIEELWWTPANPSAGECGKFYATISNQGNVDTDTYFWVGLYIKQAPSVPPLDAGDLVDSYCLDGQCQELRPHYIAYVDGLTQGESVDVAFESIAADPSLHYPVAGAYDIYIQADLAFSQDGYNLYWGRFPELDESNNLMSRSLIVAPDGRVFLPLVFHSR
ncbi:MAG: DUF11 domain-containing protein [Anaerolineae bacterium]|nr:DUF11 domain-containing protein [Anaerolineae bacterium]